MMFSRTKKTFINVYLLVIVQFFSIFFVSADEQMTVYLKGTCSSGKTSVIQLISSKWKNWAVVDDDAFVIEIWSEALASRYPNEFDSLEHAIERHNIYSALRFNDILFKQTASQEARSAAILLIKRIQIELNQPESMPWRCSVNQKVRDLVLKNIRSALSKHQNLLIDSWYFSYDELEKLFPQLHMHRVLLYCPLPIAFQRLMKRNLEGDEKHDARQKRNIAQLMTTYFWLYRLNQCPSQPTETIDLHQLRKFFQEIAKNLPSTLEENRAALFTYGEFAQSEFQRVQQEFMLPAQMVHGNTWYIEPKIRQHAIIDSSLHTSQEIVEILETFLGLNFSSKNPSNTPYTNPNL